MKLAARTKYVCVHLPETQCALTAHAQALPNIHEDITTFASAAAFSAAAFSAAASSAAALASAASCAAALASASAFAFSSAAAFACAASTAAFEMPPQVSHRVSYPKVGFRDMETGIFRKASQLRKL
jgi:hypothetical protein